MKLVKFTDVNGQDVWINPTYVIGVQPSCTPSTVKEWRNNHTNIECTRWIYQVQESVDEVVNKIDIWLS